MFRIALNLVARGGKNFYFFLPEKKLFLLNHNVVYRLRKYAVGYDFDYNFSRACEKQQLGRLPFNDHLFLACAIDEKFSTKQKKTSHFENKKKNTDDE